jgi:hypothetical protein
VEAEVAGFLGGHADKLTDDGRARLVRHGHLPEREIMTGIGPVAIVERTIAWLNRCRRLAKDWENPNRNALAFLKLVSIRLMLRKLCNPC